MPVFKEASSALTPVGGGIPHGVLPEMGPGGNVGQLTEHRPRWTGAHETVQSSPDTKQKCNRKAQTDTGACREGAGAAGSGCCTEPDPSESKNKGGKSGSVSRAPDLAKDLVPESVSGSVSNSHTDKVTATCLEPVTAEVQDVETADGPEAAQARKFSVDANPETARPRRESTGEHRPQRKTLKYNTTPPLPNLRSNKYAALTFTIKIKEFPMFYQFYKAK